MKRLKSAIAATGLLLSSFSWLAAVPVKAVAPATCTWDGGGTTNNVSDLDNWDAGCTETPSAVTDVVFPITASKKTVVIDNAGPAFKSILINGVSASSTGYTISSGNTLSLTNGIAVSHTGTATTTVMELNLKLDGSQEINLNGNSLTLGKTDKSNTLNMNGKDITGITGTGLLTINSVISGAGAITSSIAGLTLVAANTWTGALNISAGVLYVQDKDSLGSSSAGTTIADGALIYFVNTASTMPQDLTISEPITLGNTANATTPKVYVWARRDVASSAYAYTSGPYFILSGAVNITSNVLITSVGTSDVDLKLTGAITGAGKTITVESGKDFELVLAGSSNTTATANGTYKSQSGTVYVNNNEDKSATGNNTLLVSAGVSAGNMTVGTGATLKGVGTVKAVTVTGGYIAPGLSPGCLTATGAVSFTGGALDVEMNGKTVCTDYDQLIIDTEGTINLGSGANAADIKITRTGFTPAVGDKFTVINNKNTVAISGTFNGWAEGIAKKIGGITYVVTYKGGDGNDVVLEVTAVDAAAASTTTATAASTATTTSTTPGTPNTGLNPAKIFANLLIVSFIGVAISWVLVNNNKRSTAKSKK